MRISPFRRHPCWAQSVIPLGLSVFFSLWDCSLRERLFPFWLRGSSGVPFGLPDFCIRWIAPSFAPLPLRWMKSVIGELSFSYNSLRSSDHRVSDFAFRLFRFPGMPAQVASRRPALAPHSGCPAASLFRECFFFLGVLNLTANSARQAL